MFDSKITTELDQPGMLSDSDHDNSAKCFDEDEPPILNSQGSDAESAQPQKLSTVLSQWNLSIDPEDVPVLILPSPICFLMLHGKIKHAIVRCCWHERLIDRHNHRYMRMPLFTSTSSRCVKRTSISGCRHTFVALAHNHFRLELPLESSRLPSGFCFWTSHSFVFCGYLCLTLS